MGSKMERVKGIEPSS